MNPVCPDSGLRVEDCYLSDCGCEDIRELWAMYARRDEVRDPDMRARLDHWIALMEKALLEHDRLVVAS